MSKHFLPKKRLLAALLASLLSVSAFVPVVQAVPLFTYPDGMAGQVVWASENEAVAIVRDGQVTGIGPGMTTITASIGDVVAKCTVYVG